MINSALDDTTQIFLVARAAVRMLPIQAQRFLVNQHYLL
jgi:hypothetical protein